MPPQNDFHPRKKISTSDETKGNTTEETKGWESRCYCCHSSLYPDSAAVRERRWLTLRVKSVNEARTEDVRPLASSCVVPAAPSIPRSVAVDVSCRRKRWELLTKQQKCSNDKWQCTRTILWLKDHEVFHESAVQGNEQELRHHDSCFVRSYPNTWIPSCFCYIWWV